MGRFAQFLLITLAAFGDAARKIKLAGTNDYVVKQEVTELIENMKRHSQAVSHRNAKGHSLRTHSRIEDEGHEAIITRMDQLYEGRRVYGGQVVNVELKEKVFSPRTKDNPKSNRARFQYRRRALQSISGLFYDILWGELRPAGNVTAMAEPLAIDLCRKAAVKRGYQAAEKATTKTEEIIYVDNISGLAQYAFYCVLDLRAENANPHMIVSVDGTTLEAWDGVVASAIGTGPSGNIRIGKSFYGTNREKLDVNVVKRCILKGKDGSCLQTADFCIFSTPDIATVNLKSNTDFVNWNTPFEYPCYNQAGDEVNGGYSPVNDAHFHAMKTIQMFKDWYSGYPLSVRPLTVNVHFGTGIENAYFAYNELILGDGASYIHPMTSLDIIAHEIGHGVTSANSGLINNGQAGGLNEAFSDMTAMAVIRYVRGLSAVSFKIGDELVKGGGYFRCMDDPRCDGHSISHVSQYSSQLDPHYNSGIFNNIFYKLSRRFAYDVWDAYDIFLVANRYKWTPTTNFYDAAEGVLEAAEFLKSGSLTYTYDHINMADIVAVFREAGITCSKVNNLWNCF